MNPIAYYSYRVFWSPTDSEFVAVCSEIPGLSGLGPSEEAAINELKVAISVWLKHLRSKGLPVPQPDPQRVATTSAESAEVKFPSLPAGTAANA